MANRPLLNLRQIEVFRSVMLTGSVVGAARALGVSQPGITRMIRHIESRLGVMLFQRRHGRLAATEEARSLYREVQRVYEGVEAVQALAAGLRDGTDVRLRVLTSPNMGFVVLPRAMARLAEEFPHLRLALEVAPATDMLARLIAGRAEIAFSSVPLQHPMLDTAAIGEWRMVCVLPARHRLLRRRQLDPVEILRQRHVTFAPDTPQGAVIRTWLARHGIEPLVSVEVRAGQLACALVRAGMGIGFVDDITATSYADHGLVTRPLDASPRFPITCATSTQTPPPAAATRLRELVCAELQHAAAGDQPAR